MATSVPWKSHKEYQRDHEVFGELGRALRCISRDAWETADAHKYGFLECHAFEELLYNDPKTANMMYWGEILQRTHSVAMLNLRRHEMWQEACIAAFAGDGNYLAFGTALRGMLEADLDGYYSLRGVPVKLARDYETITAALKGQLKEFVTSSELEECLIHFSFARKVDKKKHERVPDSHHALDPWEYRKRIECPDVMTDGFRRLYDDLCALSHPTSIGLELFWTALPDGRYGLRKENEDRKHICDLLHQYKSVIDDIFMLTTNSAGVTLRLLNHFPFPYAYKSSGIGDWHNDRMDQWQFSVWSKLDGLMRVSTTPGGPVN